MNSDAVFKNYEEIVGVEIPDSFRWIQNCSIQTACSFSPRVFFVGAPKRTSENQTPIEDMFKSKMVGLYIVGDER